MDYCRFAFFIIQSHDVNRTVVIHLERIPGHHKVILDISDQFHLIDGNRAHFVEEFAGERFSIVFFTCGSYQAAPKKLKNSVVAAGAEWPTQASMAYFKKKLPTPQGYEAPVELEAASSKCKSRKRKREGTVETLNTVGGRFKLLDFPHLHMHLKLGETYSTASLVRR